MTLAVVVQRMIDATAAGVMFTANPITGTRHETVIDASPGLGEAVVSGAVNPDHFVVNTLDRSIVARRLGDKRMMITSRPGGGTELHELTSGASEACLDDEQVLQLVDLGQRAQRQYGAPQDTEWALDAGGSFWLTQARPITTLYPLIRTDRPGLRVFMCLSLAQGLTRPITPMGIAAIRLIGSSIATEVKMPPAQPLAGPAAMHAPGQRLFLDLTSALRNRVGRRVILGAFGVMEARAATVLKRLAERPEFSIIETRDHTVLRHIVAALIRNRVPLRAIAGLINPNVAYRGVAATERRLHQTLTLPANATASQRLDFVEQRLGSVFLLMPRTFAYAVGGLLMLAASRRLLGDVARAGRASRGAARPAPQRHYRNGSRALETHRADPRRRAVPCRLHGIGGARSARALSRAKRCHRSRNAGCRASCAATAIAPSQKLISACRAGQMIRATCSE